MLYWLLQFRWLQPPAMKRMDESKKAPGFFKPGAFIRSNPLKPI